MDKKHINLINELVAKVFPRFKEILVVFLYGSVARGDYSLRHSDLDLFIVVKKRLIQEAWKGKLEREVVEAGLPHGIRVHPEFQSMVITPDDHTLIRKMIEEGQIIYSTGVFSFGSELVGLKQYLIYDFSLKNVSRKTMFSKVLHGRVSWYWKGEKKVVKTYKGIIDNQQVVELGKGTLMVRKDRETDMKNIFASFGVPYSLRRIVYA